MKVSEETWREKAANFQKRITEKPYPKNLQFYTWVVSKVYVGEIVLDVGCGDCHLKEVLPKGTRYIGIDPFPRKTQPTLCVTAEDLNRLQSERYDTVFALASLDNVQDLELALSGIAKVAKKNVVIVTGIGIEPDSLHTLRVDMADFKEPFKSWTLTVLEEIKPNVFLLEFTKP